MYIAAEHELFSNVELLSRSCFLYRIAVEQVFLEEERKAFVDDYRITACMNVLKWFVATVTDQVPRIQSRKIRNRDRT
jgi:hypothetical protein